MDACHTTAIWELKVVAHDPALENGAYGFVRMVLLADPQPWILARLSR